MEKAMRKHNKTIPKDFGETLSVLMDRVTKGKYNEETVDVMTEMAARNKLSKMLVSKDETEKKICDQVLNFMYSAMNFSLMAGYMFGQYNPFECPGVTKDLNYLSSRIPSLNGEKIKNVFFRRNALLQKIVDVYEGKTPEKITEHEIEKASTAIVLCWPKNQEAIKDIAEKIKKGIPEEARVNSSG